MARLFQRMAGLGRDRKGGAIVEFAIVAPVLLTMIFFVLDAGIFLYAKGLLEGEVNAAGRASTLETATDTTRAALDNHVRDRIHSLLPGAEISFTRTSFRSYSRAESRAEQFIDSNSNGVCDNGETFADENVNGTYDVDAGVTGNGGARDVVIYTATMEYEKLTPIASLIGWENHTEIAASTILRNQPYDRQGQPVDETCP